MHLTRETFILKFISRFYFEKRNLIQTLTISFEEQYTLLIHYALPSRNIYAEILFQVLC